jgi:DNA polymerase family A
MTYSQIVTLDFETYYSSEYSLRSKALNTSEYIRHSEFKAQCVGIKLNDQPVVWYRDRDIQSALDAIDWSATGLLCHHTAFDGLVLSHHYGIVPAFYLDTLSMARALHSNAIGASLDEVARFYNLGNKLPNVLDKTKGVRDLPDDLMQQLGQYCAVDVELCKLIFTKMIQGFPQSELELIDLTVRMFCDPVLHIDIPRVEKELEREIKEREQLIADSGTDIKSLSSSDKFAAELRKLGIDPPTKISPTTNKGTWAFSKTDLDFIDLKTHHDERVRKLVAGRLAAKSTIGESRANRFLSVGKDNKKLPVYLNYFGAHTGRWSAGNKMNLQNLKRGGELRKSIIAPEGHVIVVADSAQIEARVTAWLAEDAELLTLFAEKADVYKHMASEIYQIPTDTVTKDQRFIGKIAVLGLGYGMGHAKFQHTLATGAMGPAVELSTDECMRIVKMYRLKRMQITWLWHNMELMLHRMIGKREGTLGPLWNDNQYRIWLPNGLYLQYPFLSADWDNINEKYVDFRYYDYEAGVRRIMGGKVSKEEGKRIYGGLATENVVQALARIIVGDQMLRIANNLKETSGVPVAGSGPEYRRVVTMTHDEVVVCVPAAEADDTLKMMLREMSTALPWCSDIPLSAEGGYDVNYSK